MEKPLKIHAVSKKGERFMRKIKGLFAGISLLVCALCVFSGCGKQPITPWGKTLVFAGITSTDDLSYTVDGKVLSLKRICVDYFDKIEWESSLGTTKESLISGENAYKTIQEKLNADFDKKALQEINFTFGTKDEKTVTIQGKKYNVTAAFDYKIDFEENAFFSIWLYKPNKPEFVVDYDNFSGALTKMTARINLQFPADVLLGEKGYETQGGGITVVCYATYK